MLPKDLHKASEDPIYSTLEDCTKELIFDDKLVRNSYLNSLTAFDYVTRTQICPVNQNFSSLASLAGPSGVEDTKDYRPYQHRVSD